MLESGDKSSTRRVGGEVTQRIAKPSPREPENPDIPDTSAPDLVGDFPRTERERSGNADKVHLPPSRPERLPCPLCDCPDVYPEMTYETSAKWGMFCGRCLFTGPRVWIGDYDVERATDKWNREAVVLGEAKRLGLKVKTPKPPRRQFKHHLATEAGYK